MSGGRAPSHLRRDVQGLRAVAVLAVIANHAVGWPAGGFLGVDVFFVISGFIITALLLRESDRTGRVPSARMTPVAGTGGTIRDTPAPEPHHREDHGDSHNAPVLPAVRLAESQRDRGAPGTANSVRGYLPARDWRR